MRWRRAATLPGWVAIVFLPAFAMLVPEPLAAAEAPAAVEVRVIGDDEAGAVISATATVTVQAGNAPAPPANGAVPQLNVGDEAGEQEFLRGAHLETDFEADRLLRRAREFAEADPPQFRKAVLVLQHVIEQGANVLATADERTYHPVREMAERLIARMGPEGLAAYRTEVDGEVRALVGSLQENRDEETLQTIETRYFLSTAGDEAAFTLACLYLDSHQYARARRLLGRLVRQYPDSSLLRGEVLLRLAVACHRCGDPGGARAAWKELERLGTPGPSPEVVAAVRAEVDAPVARPAAGPVARRTAVVEVAPDLPDTHVQGPRGLWVPVWQRPLAIIPAGIPARYLGLSQKSDVAEVEQRLREQLRGRWDQSDWVPVGSVLVDGQDLFVRSSATLMCLDAATGNPRWKTLPPPEPEGTQVGFSFHPQIRGTNAPRTVPEVLAFADQISKAVSVVGDRVYQVEDHPVDQWTARHRHVVIRVVNGKQQRVESKDQPRGNRLVAYDRRTGQVAWRLGRTLDEADPLHGMRFLAPPVACGRRLLVPVEKEGELSLAALDPDDGRPLWQTFLCSFAVGRQQLWDEVGLLVDRSDVYVAMGQGVVFALDGVDGAIHWAARYERTMSAGGAPNVFQSPTVGWRANRLVLDGHRLAVLPVDAEAVLVLDASSGGLVARHPTPGLRRCLGAGDGRLWAAAPNLVRCVDLGSGQSVWEVSLESDRGYGLGFVTREAVYVPAGRGLLRLDRATGHRLASLGVLTPDDVPVGNVAGDGRRLFVLGPGRVYALVTSGERLAELQQTLATTADALAARVGRQATIDRDVADARQTLQAVAEPIATAGRALDDLRTKQADAAKEMEAVAGRIAALRDERARLPAKPADAQDDHEAATVTARRQELDRQLAAETVRHDALADQQKRLPADIEARERQLRQLQASQADSQARIKQLEENQTAHRADLAGVRRRYLAASLERARIERGHAWHDRAAATYRAALALAGDEPLKEQVRLGLLDVLLDKARLLNGPAARDALTEAGKVAAGPAEALRVKQVLAAHHERSGDVEDALAVYLGMTGAGSDTLLARDGPRGTWTVTPAGVAMQGVRSLLEAHGDRLRPVVAEKAQAALDQARHRKDPWALRGVFRMFTGTGVAVEAGVAAAAAVEAAGSFEVAELILQEMQRSGHPPAQAAALAHLARMHQDRGWTAQARVEWQRLANAWPDVAVGVGKERRAAGILARRQIQALGPPTVADTMPAVPAPPWQQLWKVQAKAVRLLIPSLEAVGRLDAPGASQFLAEHAFMWTLADAWRFMCVRLSDGKVIYTSEPGRQPTSFSGNKAREAHAIVGRSGQTLSAMGLVSGRALWSETWQPSSTQTRLAFSRTLNVFNLLRHSTFKGFSGTGRASTGVFVFNPDANAVRALDLATGRLLWQRAFRRQEVVTVQEAGSYVCLLMDGGQELWVCDPLTGALRNTIGLGMTQTHPWAFAMTADGFFEQPYDPKTRTYRLVLRDLPTGRERWATGPAAQPTMIYLIDDRAVCLIANGRDFEVRDPETGAVRCRVAMQAVVGQQLGDLCLGPEGRLLYAVTRNGQRGGLTILDLEAGEVTRTYDFGESPSYRPLPAELYAVAGEYLPWAKRVERGSQYQVQFYRRSDGKPAEGIALPSAEGDGAFEHLTTIVCRNGVLLVVTNRYVEAFGHDSGGGQLVAE